MAERFLGIDFDNVIADTAPHMLQTLEVQYPGKFTSKSFEPKTPDEELELEFSQIRGAYLRNTEHISSLPLCEGTPLALSILWNFFDRIDVISARWENQRPFLDKLLRTSGLSRNISSVFLRPRGVDDQSTVKVDVSRIAGINYAAEDNGMVAVNLAKEGIRVALIDRPWNKWVPNTTHVRRYEELVHFALDLILYKSPEELFSRHSFELGKIGYLYTIHRVTVSQAAEIIMADSEKMPSPALS
ncbi:hypothetical protein M1437_00590 [Patescibacteria group bacterium]|nr:hypothetical protein [Patescibacteria group bacterium]